MNYLDIGKDDFIMCDDLTGKPVNISKRVDAIETLSFINDVYSSILASKPKVETFEIHFAIQRACKHFGWTPSEIAVIEQYAAINKVISSVAAINKENEPAAR